MEIDQEYREKLLALLKKEVKHVMEEAVTKKFVHEESSCVSALCCAIDACLSHGLRRRALGLFKTNSTMALLQKVAKNHEPSASLFSLVLQIEKNSDNKRSSSSSDSLTALGQKKKPSPYVSPKKFLWIRIALFEKKLMPLVEHLVSNSTKYYEKEALLAEAVCGQIFASLLIGPCSLEYSKMKTQDHVWTDPSADELIQRQRMNPLANGNATPPSGRKPLGVTYRRSTMSDEPSSSSKNSDTFDESHTTRTSVTCSPRNHFDSLHQNLSSTLLYGKNNVYVQSKCNDSAVPGYLSLHATSYSLEIKWTPNQLMNHSTECQVTEKSADVWTLPLNFSLADIVYIHCHKTETGGTVVFVGLDGVQMPPMQFPAGCHLLAFITCLENGLTPFGRLDPPLSMEEGKGKVFPRLRLKGSASGTSSAPDENESADYVFRIVPMDEEADVITHDMIDPKNCSKATTSPWTQFVNRNFTSSSSTNSTCQSIDETAPYDKSIQSMCDSMRRQIMCRAFSGWLSYTRHIKTVTTHLAQLVMPLNCIDESIYTSGVTPQIWASLFDETGAIPETSVKELFAHLYFGGCDGSIRKAVWPYLLRHYKFSMVSDDRKKRDLEMQQLYEMLMAEWMAVEAIVKQRDKELTAANLAKLSSESNNSTEIPPPLEGRSASNDVFCEENTTTTTTTSTATATASNITSQVSISSTTSTNSDRPKSGRISRQKQLEDQVTDVKIDDDIDATAPSPTCGGGVYSTELLDLFSLNLHRIEKDVQRCDRNYYFYAEKENLEKLRNVMCTYVWQNLDQGYVQGMCDLVAPLLVTFKDEVITYSCFVDLMKRMLENFPNGGAMDEKFANLRALIQVLDCEIFDLMRSNGDYTHFYFCYRWFLLDFKRELVYEDVFRVWETIWAAEYICSRHFVLFIAAALVQLYRDVIIANNMDFTDIIKFFNEMAEKHDVQAILKVSRSLVHQIQTLIEDEK